jgi:hypothetical protein
VKKDYYLQMAIVSDKVATKQWTYQQAVNYIDISDIPATKAKKLLDNICDLDRQNRRY